MCKKDFFFLVEIAMYFRKSSYPQNKVLTQMQLYLQGFKPPDEGPSEYQSIPLNKIEDFGVHCKQ